MLKDSIQFKCICIALFTIHIVSKQLYRKCISEMYVEQIQLVNHVVVSDLMICVVNPSVTSEN